MSLVFRYFECPEDCGIFLALNRVTSKDYYHLQTPIPAPRKGVKQKYSSGSLSNFQNGSSYSRSSRLDPSP